MRAPTTYGSDSTINYELGFKGENEARTVAWDVTAFHIDWDDIQLLAVEWHRHQYERGREERRRRSVADVPAGGSAEALADGRVHRCHAHRGCGSNLVGGRDGDHLPYTPKTSYSASADYEWPLADGRSAYLGASFSHLDDVPAAFMRHMSRNLGSVTCLRTTWSTRAGWTARYPWSCSAGISPTMKARLRTRRQHAERCHFHRRDPSAVLRCDGDRGV